MEPSPQLPSGQKLLILKHLCNGAMSVQKLVSALYASRYDGGPERPDRVVITSIRYLRRSLAPYGIQILSIGNGRSSGVHDYMVDPDHVERLHALIESASRAALAQARDRATMAT